MLRSAIRLAPIVSALAVAVVMPGMGGCGGPDDLPREAVSGSVSVDGNPVKVAVITFLPDSADVPTQGGGTVTDGKYSIPRAQGLVPGKYRIVITSPEDKPKVVVDEGHNNNAPGMKPIPAKQVIPPQYNDKTLLTAEVRAGVSNVFVFNLTSMPASK
jgi:hypothetical protein